MLTDEIATISEEMLTDETATMLLGPRKVMGLGIGHAELVDRPRGPDWLDKVLLLKSINALWFSFRIYKGKSLAVPDACGNKLPCWCVVGRRVFGK
ncbi:hypothetical protein PCANC_13473 [Puccinia coronata f. sp. avenae]|uniref:Uncharacterized protein n=1 Tax=Puccinia coronata f. sp. avenae TaxID=200324 RepID=A0A2N5U6W4_9BASI|nr:hypothetical protein PCANC_16444 [Puccinia coronata f. sp. avenae]PLW44974.1 hypothetical protein PCANC_13473 [Puccinia coronata f. sp. avenae]